MALKIGIHLFVYGFTMPDEQECDLINRSNINEPVIVMGAECSYMAIFLAQMPVLYLLVI